MAVVGFQVGAVITMPSNYRFIPYSTLSRLRGRLSAAAASSVTILSVFLEKPLPSLQVCYVSLWTGKGFFVGSVNTVRTTGELRSLTELASGVAAQCCFESLDVFPTNHLCRHPRGPKDQRNLLSRSTLSSCIVCMR